MRQTTFTTVWKSLDVRAKCASRLPRCLLSTSQYDAMGDRLSLSATIGGVKDFVNSYSYDSLSRLYDIVQSGQGGNAVAPKQVYYTLDGVGDVTELDRSTSATVGATRTGPAYSLLQYSSTTGQLNSSITHVSSGSTLDTLSYGYDGVGRVQTFTSNDGQATYGYDLPVMSLSRLVPLVCAFVSLWLARG